MYNWKYKYWPHFTYLIAGFQPLSIAFAKDLGSLNGLITGLNEELKQETNTLQVKDEVTRALLKASIAHLYFESIHPFEDGNGRVGRALAEYTLSHELKSPVLLSISKVTAKKYMAIAKTSKATATRDLQHLHEIGVFKETGAGRSVRYELVNQIE